VAVVTPVFNGGPWLERTLASVQRQTWRNLVHIVLDNASTDETSRLIAACTGPVPLITRRNAETLPQTDNWNAAMAMAPPEASYVKWLCADDLMARDCIEKMVRLAESDPEIDLVLALDVVKDRALGDRLDYPRTIYTGEEIARRLLRDRMRHLPAAHMFFRIRPDLPHAPFDASTLPAIDADFVVRDLLSRKVGYLFEPLLFTRVTQDTQTSLRGGFRASLLPSLSRLTRYGPRILGKRELAQAKGRERRKLTRHALAWLAMRDPNGEKALAILESAGIRPGVLDYLVAIASWPAHKLSRETTRMSAAPPQVSVGLSECDFLPPSEAPAAPPTGGLAQPA
jgi:glycosyltransferase involved in cell wall biosynthesis